MAETPKRSLGETMRQLLVIAILIGILIGAIIVLDEFIHSHANGESSTKATFNFTCCTGLGANGAQVELYEIYGEGHEWPGRPTLPSSITALLGPQSSLVNANTLMWTFFQAHPMP